MKNKIIVFALSALMVFSTGGFSFAVDEGIPQEESIKVEKVVKEEPKQEEVQKEVKEEVVKEKAEPVGIEKEKVSEEVKETVAEEAIKPTEQKEKAKPSPTINLFLKYLNSNGHWTTEHRQLHKKDFPYYVDNPPVVEGKDFQYWRYDSHNGTRIQNPIKLGKPEPESIHIIAVYEDATVKKYPLKLVFTYEDANGLKNEITPTPTIWEGETYSAVAAPASPVGKTFSHWAKTKGNGPDVVNTGYTFNGKSTPVESEVWAYHAVYKDKLIPIEIHIEGDIVEKVWTGAEQEASGFTVVSKLPEGTEVSYDIKKAYAAHGTNVGEYDMAYEAAGFKLHGENANKYDAKFILDRQGKLIITAATYTLKINDASKTYGEDDPEFTAEWNGPVKIAYTLYRDKGEDVGEYAIRAKIGIVKPEADVSKIEAEVSKVEIEVAKAEKRAIIEKKAVSNYEIKVVNGTFTIKEKVTPPPTPSDDPIITPSDNNSTVVANNGNNAVAQANTANGQVAQTPTDNIVDQATPTTIANKKVPLVANKEVGAWAFINLLTVILNFALGILLMLMTIINKAKENITITTKNKMLLRIGTLIIAVISAIIFFITENMALPMVWIDSWTILMICIFILNLFIATLVKREKVNK